MRVGTRKNKRRLGFTLVELLVVCAIMAIIVGVAVPVVIGQIDKSQTKSDETIQKTIVNNVYNGITTLPVDKPRTYENVLGYVYENFNGAYNAAAPLSSTLGNLEHPIVPKGTDISTAPSGKCYVVEFIGYTKTPTGGTKYVDHGSFKVSLLKADGTVIIDGLENTPKKFYPLLTDGITEVAMT